MNSERLKIFVRNRNLSEMKHSAHGLIGFGDTWECVIRCVLLLTWLPAYHIVFKLNNLREIGQANIRARTTLFRGITATLFSI